MSASPAVLAVTEREEKELEAAIAKAIRPVSDVVAKMAGQQEEHRDHVKESLGRIEDSLKKQSSAIGRIDGRVESHEAQLSEIRGKGARKPFNFNGTHFTLILLAALGLVAIAGTAVGIDVLGWIQK